MGQDLVYACTPDQMLMNWNREESRRHSTIVENVTEAASIATVDGVTTCSIQLEPGLVLDVPGSNILRMFNFT